ncbi:hypothetical protein [Thalassospira xiamenensis]|uniref:hypothetical protein n=1 Tax=Thalassospira xiamenensis TaxID=220697 RepID=UPI000DED82E5|nr:hypothetical protein [Thalassospira xiamenensis]RCK33570.1 hypothetical protein TH24_21205 [Thalassospira xiamenensis]
MTKLDSDLKIPKSVLLVSRVNFDAVIHAPMIKYMCAEYGTKFTVIVGSERRKKQWQGWLGDDVRLEIEGEFTGLPITLNSAEDEYKIARAREERYGISYMRHIFHQDKGTAAVMLQHTPGSPFSSSKLPSMYEMVALTNRRFDFIEKLYAKEGIDLIVARNSGLFNSVAIAFAREHNIPSTWLNHLRTGKKMTWMEGPDHSDKLIRSIMETLPLQNPVPFDEIVPPDDTKWALDRISKEHEWGLVFKQLFFLAKNTIGHTVEDIKLRRIGKRLSAKSVALNILQKKRLIEYLNKVSVSSVNELKKQPYALFLLHLDPEYTSSTLARDFNHVHAVIQQLALSLPAGMKLVVKEHVWGLGNRRRSFYDDLLHLPNVVLADYRIRSTNLAADASFVSTVAGTITLEASLMGVPAIIFSPHTEYANLDTVHVVDNISKLREEVVAALRPRTLDQVEKSKRLTATFRAAQQQASFELPELELYADGNAARDLPIDAVSNSTVESATSLLLRVMNSQLAVG